MKSTCPRKYLCDKQANLQIRIRMLGDVGVSCYSDSLSRLYFISVDILFVYVSSMPNP
jgi:hypothetical protein